LIGPCWFQQHAKNAAIPLKLKQFTPIGAGNLGGRLRLEP